ncbi:hypothetical protein AAG565_10375 [Fontimonas sp. SYSU GA230001]|uniref:hypothetical protein n=1 Tax=Fontimonas sp. SYSU GA230001 TaxID=3142450 RepID=UPI0032B5D25D
MMFAARRMLPVVAIAAASAAFFALDRSAPAPASCPQGQRPLRQAGGEQACAGLRNPESPAELLAAKDNRNRRAGAVPDGAVRQAVERREAMKSLQAKVAGAAGGWQPYGVGNLDDGYGVMQSARVDNFAFDPVAKRLFAAVGSGGIWMSEAVDGDIRTLADHWVSVGDRLPSQVNGGVAWTPAGGGTLIAAGGEAVMGSSGYLGLGAYWSNDLGASWHHAPGVPDGALVFRAATDPGNPNVIYVASSKGLFRSSDAGRSYVNVALPTSAECAGVETLGPCQFTNYVTDVVVRHPGGSTGLTCAAAGCPVLAAVGFRVGNGLAFQDGRPMAPANGLYRSETGEPGSFVRLDVSAPDTNSPLGFAVQNRIGRIELGQATGENQDHDYVYAIVQDAELFNGGGPFADMLDPILDFSPLPFPTVFNGLYASADFGRSWVRMADTTEVITPDTGSEIALIGGALGSGAGAQAWYNEWIAVDPTRALAGVPTRLGFGLEEVWQNRLTDVPLDGLSQSGPSDFSVIGAYWGLAADPESGFPYPSTTHPDQHAGLYVPTGDGGVCLFVGNDGGIFKQCAEAGAEMSQAGWGFGANGGIYALLPYGIGVARDGTVWFGLQDNGSGHIEPDTRRIYENFGGDGFYAEVDPDNSDIAYTETQNGGLVRTTDRGASSKSIAPSYTKVMFDNWFRMDPLDAQHMVTGAQEIYETAHAQTVTGSTWVEVFNLGTNPDTGAIRTTTTMEVLGEAVYVGGCGDCGVSGNDQGFRNVLATNVGGAEAPQRETAKGWHFATAQGLPNRYITSIAIDPADPRTIYVTLAGYLSNLRPPGSYLDPNADIGAGNVFKSTDAGEHFVNVSGNLPNVQANSVILRGDQLLLGTDIGAFISADRDGSSWAPLGDGLPSVPVNMLRLQPGQPDRLFAATFGRGVWTYDLKSAGAPPAGGGGGHDGGRFGGALGLPLLVLLLLGAGLRRRR